jgi:hypothetical protein
VCYFVYLATPLTLSEVRSMLPAGLRADLAPSEASRALREIEPAAQTVVQILSGKCSCDLVRPRLAVPRDDERHHRERYRRLNVPRPVVIASLERHRARPPRSSPVSMRDALAAFVSEHARNAGTSLYFLQFCPENGSIERIAPAVRTTVAEVTAAPESWLAEGLPTFVTR